MGNKDYNLLLYEKAIKEDIKTAFKIKKLKTKRKRMESR